MQDVAESSAQATSVKKPKRFLCKHCQRRFARLEHLQRHERIHTQEKPFGCRLCGNHFTRSDLLIRHERLTHNKSNSSDAQLNDRDENGEGSSQSRPNKRRASTFAGERSSNDGVSGSPQDMSIGLRHMTTSNEAAFSSSMIASQSDEYSLAALSMAAEYSSLHGAFLTPPVPDENASTYHSLPPPNERIDMLSDPLVLQNSGHMQGLGLEESLDSLAAFLDNEPLSSYHFSSLTTAEQLPFFSPESFNYNDLLPHHESQVLPGARHNQQTVEESNSFSRFGSRLPSLQPEDGAQPEHPCNQSRPFYEVSSDDRQCIVAKLDEFTSTLPEDFQLPTRLALCRYIAGYVNGFHEHLPLIHIPTMTIEGCAVELILAMAAVGAQYCFEGEKGVELFNASQTIAVQRIRRRDVRLINSHRRADSEMSSMSRGVDGSSNIGTPPDLSTSGPLGLPSEPETSATIEREDLIQTAQALLILMAMATWAKHKEILREALAIQSILATLIRDDGLKSLITPDNASWEEWVRIETTKRTKLIVFCFFNLHCIVYNIPPLILNSEIKLSLPSSAAEFKAQSAEVWREARQSGPETLDFPEALRQLFSRNVKNKTSFNSSLGNYVLIHALIQHIFFVRQIAKCRYDGPDLKSEEVSSLEHALRNWQVGWKRNPESSLDPTDPNGPVAFNSTALLRLAYIRLNVDTGPGRALDTRDPVQIATAFRESPAIKRTPKLVRAVLHSAHALSVPVKIGVRLVAKTQTFIWSIQHSLCSLECAFLLSKWLEALSQPNPEPPITDDERRITSLVKTMLDETEFAVPSDMPLDCPATRKCLSAGVLRVWATIFKGAQTWAIVDIIGSSLNIYADMLEPN